MMLLIMGCVPQAQTLALFEAEISELLEDLDSGANEPSDIDNYASW